MIYIVVGYGEFVILEGMVVLELGMIVFILIGLYYVIVFCGLGDLEMVIVFGFFVVFGLYEDDD